MDVSAIVAGAYFALVTVFAVSGFGFALATRDRVYGLFAMHALAVGALALTFPPFFPSVDVIEPFYVFWRILAEGLMLASAGLLIAHMVFKAPLRSLRVWLGIVFPMVVLCGAGSYYLSAEPIILVIYGAVILVKLFAGVGTLAYQTARGSREAAMLSVAFAPLIAVGIYAATLEVIPGPSMQNYAEAMLLAFAFEMLIVYGMLALRLRRAMAERDHAFAHAMRAQRDSETDSLTGLPNRRAFERVFAEDRARFDALAIIDCDRFKDINDRFGHAAGDEVLRAIGKSLSRSGTFAARIGGEEFALLLRGRDWAEQLETLRAELSRDVRRFVPEVSRHVTASAGAASLTNKRSLKVAMRHADAALYEAKKTGRDRSKLASQIDEPLPKAA